MPQTSKWQTHLPYLQLEPLLVHKSLFPQQPLYQLTVADLGQLSKLCACVESPGKSPLSLPVGPRSHQCVNKQIKNCFCYFFFQKIDENYACNDELCQKLCQHNLSSIPVWAIHFQKWNRIQNSELGLFKETVFLVQWDKKISI